MITVYCVLARGGWCGPGDVLRLESEVAANLHVPHRFVCLTDTTVPGIECLPLVAKLPDGAPKWWFKMELWRPGLLSGRCLYFDLDTRIVGDLCDLAAYSGAFAGISDFYRPTTLQTGVMAWDADGIWPAKLWDAWHPEASNGSQARLVANVLRGREDRLDQLYPGAIISYKCHVRKQGRIPLDARVVCLHGKPRPAEVADEPCWRRAA